MTDSVRALLDWLDGLLRQLANFVLRWIGHNVHAVLMIALIALVSYGFEIFNINITIDDETAMLKIGPDLTLAAIDRWMAYLLSAILIPYTPLPVVSLAFSLAFHILGSVMLCDAWDVKSAPERIITGAIVVCFPAWAYLYSFAPVVPFIGPGIFLCATSIVMFARLPGWFRLLAAMPASMALGIYLAFLPLLTTIFLIYVATRVLQNGKDWRLLFWVGGVLISSIGLHLVINQLFLQVFSVQRVAYSEGFLPSVEKVWMNLPSIIWHSLDALIKVGSGGVQSYGVSLHFLPVLLTISVFRIAFYIIVPFKADVLIKVFVMLMVALAIIINFISFSLLFKERHRFLIGVSVTIAGVYVLAALQARVSTRSILFALGCLVVFQFAQAANRWSASSYLSMQADQLLATRIISAIEQEIVRQPASVELKYLEVVGPYNRAPSQAIFDAADVSNYSIFSFGPRSTRVAALLNILGFQRLTGAPPQKRLVAASHAMQMPNWPADGSVKIFGETVIVKFSPYAKAERRTLCNFATQLDDPLKGVFCDNN